MRAGRQPGFPGRRSPSRRPTPSSWILLSRAVEGPERAGARSGLVDAGRIRSQDVAGQRVGPRPRAPAETAVLADAALALKTVGVAKRPEDGALPVDLSQACRPNVPGGIGKESARVDLPRVRDEAVAAPA